MANKTQEKFKSKIGGQALIEGIMMRGIDKASMSLRLPTGEIETETWEIKNGKNPPWYRRCPFIRGSFNFVTSMVDGYKCLSKSADRAMDFEEEDEEPETKFEKWLDDHIGDKLMPIVMTLGIILGVGLAVVLFMWLPSMISSLLGKVIPLNSVAKTIIEGVIKIVLFLAYMALTALMKDIRRTYEYHGAEHKTITCYEAQMELTVENVKKCSRFHPRCGTSFLILTLIVSIIITSVLHLPWDNIALRIGIKILLIPVYVGITYEFIRLAGRYSNPFTRILSAPGLWVQRITTREPDDSEIEVAIEALNACKPDDQSIDRW